MSPAQVLISEHGPIIKGLNYGNMAVDKLECGDEVPREFWAKELEFLKGFADKCHHAKEEKYFLPQIAAKGTKKYQAYVKVVFAEHELGRAYLAEVEQAVNKFYKGDKGALKSISSNFGDYAEMLKNHIIKENLYFLACEKEFLQGDIADLQKQFEKEEKELGEGTHERYMGLLEELKKLTE